MITFQIYAILKRIFASFQTFKNNEKGNIALLFALVLVPVVGMVGLGIDTANTLGARNLMTLAAQGAATACASNARGYLTRGLDDATAHNQAVSDGTNFFNNNTSARAGIVINSVNVTIAQSVTLDTTCTVNFSGTFPTSFASIFGIQTFQIGGTETFTVPINLIVVNDNDFFESFETLPYAQTIDGPGDYGFNDYPNYNGWVTLGGNALVQYVHMNEPNHDISLTNLQGGNFNGLEIGNTRTNTNNTYGATGGTPNGVNVAELDSNSNSSISRHFMLKAGSYELRYYYYSRIQNNNYKSTWVCGAQSSDVDWALAPDSYTGNIQTNRIGVYFDKGNGSGVPPAKTWSSTLQRNRFDPQNNNLIDVCVASGMSQYSTGWIMRAINITVTQAGDYWLSFQAEGASDSVGGLLDSITFCANSCSYSSWGPIYNNYQFRANQEIFTDRLGNLSCIVSSPVPCTSETILQLSGLSQNNYLTGTPILPHIPVGWAVEDSLIDNQIYSLPQYNGMSIIKLGGPGNKVIISRRLPLDPGVYYLQYQYISQVPLTYFGTTSPIGLNGSASCDTNWDSSLVSSFKNFQLPVNGIWTDNPGVYENTLSSVYTFNPSYPASPFVNINKQYRVDTNQMSVFIDNDQLVSHIANTQLYSPDAKPTINSKFYHWYDSWNLIQGDNQPVPLQNPGQAPAPFLDWPDGMIPDPTTLMENNIEGIVTPITNPSSTVTAAINQTVPPTMPQLPQNRVDTCVYSYGFTTRNVYFKITKPGMYWISFRGEGGYTWDGSNVYDGAAVANIRLFTWTGINIGPANTLGIANQAIPANTQTIPAPGLPAGSTISYPNGISVVHNN